MRPEKKKEKNETFQSDDQYLEHRERIMEHVWHLICGLRTNSALTLQDRQDLLGEVGVRLWRSRLRVPRARGQATYIRITVCHTLYDFWKTKRALVLVVLSEGVNIKTVLPKAKMRRVGTISMGGSVSTCCVFEGHVSSVQLAELLANEKVVSVVPIYAGTVDLISRDAQADESSEDPIEAVSSTNPWPALQARMDKETILEKLGKANANGVLAFKEQREFGKPWIVVATDMGYSTRACQVHLNKLEDSARQQFPEFG